MCVFPNIDLLGKSELVSFWSRNWCSCDVFVVRAANYALLKSLLIFYGECGDCVGEARVLFLLQGVYDSMPARLRWRNVGC